MDVYYVYIMSNHTGSVLYVGVTNDLERRVSEHKNKVNDGFTKRYNVNRLVYYEACTSITSSIAREKQLKSRSRAKKEALIDTMNPERKDLSETWNI